MRFALANRIGNNKVRFKDAVLALFSICTIRNIEEAVLNHRQILDNPNNEWRTWITVFFHYNSFWLLVFGLLVLLIYVFTRKNSTIRECLVVGLFATPIILLPPILNVLLGDNGSIGYPHNPLHLVDIIPHFLNAKHTIQGVTIGMRWEIVIAGIAGALFIYHKTNKVIRSVIGFISICIVILLTGSFAPLIAQFYENGLQFSDDFRLYDSTLFHGGHLFETFSQRIALLYMFFVIIISLIVILIYDKKLLNTLAANLRLTRTLHYLILFFGGFILSISFCQIDHLELEHSNGWMDEMANPFDYFGVFMAAISLFLAFEGAVVFNDIYDIAIDRISGTERPLVRKGVDIHRYKTIGIVCFLGSLSIAFCINEAFLFLMLSFVLLSCLYSMPPFRCRNSLLLSCLILALEALIAFAAGSSVFVQSSVFQVVPDELTLSLLLAYLLVIPIKDIKDYEGDKNNHVRTLLTIFGKTTGTFVTYFLVCLTILGLPILLGICDMKWISAGFVLLFSILSMLNKERKIKHFEFMVFLLYFCYLILLFHSIIQTLS